MYTRRQVPAEVTRLAREQSGVVSRAQAIGLGLGPTVIRRLLLEGRWGRFDAGLYLVPDIDPTWRAKVWAAILVGGPDARAAGATAASLHGLTESEALPIEVLIPTGKKVLDRPWVTFRQERVGVRAVSTRAVPPATRVADTVLDLCARGSEAAAISWVTAAVQRRLTTSGELLSAMNRRARLPNRLVLREVLSDVAGGVHSALEHRYRHDVELAHGLPTAERQRSVAGRAEFVDVWYRRFGVLIELDGRIGHVGEGMWRDRRRDNAHARASQVTLRYGWQEVCDQPCAIATEVFEVLISRGCAGYPDRCGRCAG